MYYDERGWYISEEDLKADYELLKADGETNCETYEEYVRECCGKNGTLTKSERKMEEKWCLCKNCIDAIKSRGEPIWVGPKVFDVSDIEYGEPEQKCDLCNEVDNLYDCK